MYVCQFRLKFLSDSSLILPGVYCWSGSDCAWSWPSTVAFSLSVCPFRRPHSDVHRFGSWPCCDWWSGRCHCLHHALSPPRPRQIPHQTQRYHTHTRQIRQRNPLPTHRERDLIRHKRLHAHTLYNFLGLSSTSWKRVWQQSPYQQFFLKWFFFTGFVFQFKHQQTLWTLDSRSHCWLGHYTCKWVTCLAAVVHLKRKRKMGWGEMWKREIWINSCWVCQLIRQWSTHTHTHFMTLLFRNVYSLVNMNIYPISCRIFFSYLWDILHFSCQD